MAGPGSGGERTEKPSAKKLKDARERGQVARSTDLSGAISLVGVTLALGWFGASIASRAGERLEAGLSTFGDQARNGIDVGAITSMVWSDGALLAQLAGPPALIAAAASIGASLLQVGWAVSPKAMELQWSRLSPSSGLQRLAPSYSGPELAKAVIGISALGVLCYFFVREFYERAPMLVGMSPAESSAYGWDRVWTLLWRSSIALAILGGLDYLVQYWRFYTQQKMTRQEVRDEAKMSDGNPEIKSRVRRIQRDMTRRRMLNAVKTATVVITNPTHYAVALEYRRAEMSAPVVVAKGQDVMAARIRKVAREHNVPIVENVTLARALHKHADIGETIPADLFGAVAEILAYLVRLKQLVL